MKESFGLRLWLIHRLDWIDDRILEHRWIWLCRTVAKSTWWGKEPCTCEYCQKFSFSYYNNNC